MIVANELLQEDGVLLYGQSDGQVCIAVYKKLHVGGNGRQFVGWMNQCYKPMDGFVHPSPSLCNAKNLGSLSVVDGSASPQLNDGHPV